MQEINIVMVHRPRQRSDVSYLLLILRLPSAHLKPTPKEVIDKIWRVNDLIKWEKVNCIQQCTQQGISRTVSVYQVTCLCDSRYMRVRAPVCVNERKRERMSSIQEVTTFYIKYQFLAYLCFFVQSCWVDINSTNGYFLSCKAISCYDVHVCTHQLVPISLVFAHYLRNHYWKQLQIDDMTLKSRSIFLSICRSLSLFLTNGKECIHKSSLSFSTVLYFKLNHSPWPDWPLG